MRILLVQDAEWRKKGPHQQHHLMERLSLRGHEIMVIGFDQLWKEEKDGFFSRRVMVNGICRFYKNANVTFIRPSFIRLSILDYISFFFSSRKEIKKQIKEFDPDVIIGFSSVLSNYWGMKFAIKNNIPFIYYWYDIIHVLNIPKPFGPIAKLIEKQIIKKSIKIITINEVLKDYLLDFGADPSITEVIPGGVDFERFNPSKIDSQKIREKNGISKDDTVLFFMGWMYEFSGLKEVILELSKNKNGYPTIKVMAVGEGEYYPQLKEIIKNSSMQDRVILTGKRPYEEIPRLISAADICLLPAYNNEVMRDIVPIKMYEYLAMNKPVISTKLPGIMKEFGHDNGVIYVDKPEDAIKKVIQLSKEDIERNSLMAKKFIKKCDWNIIISQFEGILESLVREGIK